MATTTLPAQPVTSDRAAISSSSSTIPLYLYATVLASFSIMIGLVWDISWHTSIGRDGLLSAPHLAIYFGGVLAGVFSGIRVLQLTFAGSPAQRNESVRFWGVFYGSLGTLFCIWGAFAMLTSAPFDDWWHNTYGLDVTILSPPHTVLLLGMVTIQLGAMVSVLSRRNRLRLSTGYASLQPRTRRIMAILFALSAGFMLSMLFTIASEYFSRHDMHGSLFYQVGALLFPLYLVAISWAAPNRWGASQAALVYTLFMAAMVWILPLFPAEPLLGPVLNPITHFQAFEFPLLLLIPALAIDLMVQRLRQRNAWLIALAVSVVFVLLFLAVQWPLGNFLMSPYARNWFFGTESWYFGNDPDWEFRYAYADYMVSSGLDLAKGLGVAVLIGVLSTRLGISWGRWMNKVVR